jgi:hypothetical protein
MGWKVRKEKEKGKRVFVFFLLRIEEKWKVFMPSNPRVFWSSFLPFSFFSRKQTRVAWLRDCFVCDEGDKERGTMACFTSKGQRKRKEKKKKPFTFSFLLPSLRIFNILLAGPLSPSSLPLSVHTFFF